MYLGWRHDHIKFLELGVDDQEVLRVEIISPKYPYTATNFYKLK